MRTYSLTRYPARTALTSPFAWDSIFNRFFDLAPSPAGQEGDQSVWRPDIDVVEDAQEIRIRADVPGIDPKNLKVEVLDNLLTIEGAREEAAEGDESRTHWTERVTGAFRRVIQLPEHVEGEALKAKYEQGVLTVTAPVKAKVLPREIEVSLN